jgi:hypothetical protein
MELSRARRLLGEYVRRLHHDEGRAGDQVMRLEQSVEFKVTKPNDFLSCWPREFLKELECFEGNYYVRDRFALGVALARAQFPDS